MGEQTGIDGAAVLGSVGERAGGRQLLELAARREDVELIGGAVRDLLLGRAPRELDVVVGEDAAGFARELADRLGSGPSRDGRTLFETTLHERFGTAAVRWPGGEIDVATRRAERYAAPGALPEVLAGTPEQDLRRRDFSVNAIAVSLGGPRRGELRAAEHALEDLAARRLRVLHDASFLDDPTRLLRLARYSARLAFDVEEKTMRLAEAARDAQALATVSGARIGAELRLALGEANAIASLAAIDGLGLLAALDPRLSFREELAREALELLPEDGRPELLLLAALVQPMLLGRARDVESATHQLLESLEFPASDRSLAVQAAVRANALAEELQRATRCSEVYEMASRVPPEAVALAGAWGDLEWGADSDAGRSARQWLERLRHVRLRITGEDLLAAGVAPGPEIGARLKHALHRKLDGELPRGPERESELSAALEGR